MTLFEQLETVKSGKVLVFGEWGCGKSTFCTTAPGPRYWIDAEHGSDHIRDPQDFVFYATGFKELQEAITEIRHTPNVGTLIIDPYTIFWERLIDQVESGLSGDMQFRDWSKAKKPNKRMFTDLLNLPFNIILTTHQADVFEMRKNDKGKLEPVKVGVKIDAEKKTAYSPDVVMRMFTEGGKYKGEIMKVRIRKELALKTGLIKGAVFENPTWDTFLPIFEAYAHGVALAHYSDDRETSEKDEQVFEQIDREQQDTARKKIIGQVERAEKKLGGMKVFGFRGEEEIDQARRVALGTNVLSEAAQSDLDIYYKGLCDTGVRAKEDAKNVG